MILRQFLVISLTGFPWLFSLYPRTLDLFLILDCPWDNSLAGEFGDCVQRKEMKRNLFDRSYLLGFDFLPDWFLRDRLMK